MKIAEAAERSGLSADTIRFYEREGLLPAIERGRDGHRRFSNEALRWLNLFERLRSTGMPLADMKRYAALSAQGVETFTERREMLERHHERLAAAQARINACRALIDEKIATYRSLEAGRRRSRGDRP